MLGWRHEEAGNPDELESIRRKSSGARVRLVECPDQVFFVIAFLPLTETPCMDETTSPRKPPRVRSMEFVECDQMMEMVRDGNGEFIQAGKGICLGSMRQINLDGIQILCADLSNKTIVHAAANPDIKVVHLPLSWVGEMRWNGREIDRPGGIVWGKNAQWSRVASDSCIVTLGLQQDTLFSSLAKWTQQDPEESWWFKGHILNQTIEARSLLAIAWEVVELSKRDPEAFDVTKFADGIRDSLLTGLLSATSVEACAPAESVPWSRRNRAVIAATEFMREHEEQDVCLLDLCNVSGVSARTLEYAFQETIGIRPMQYLRIRRLKRARSLLKKGITGETSVTACATSAGFTHLGRFSVDYRKFFGESPSTTLARPS